ncbi:MAG: tRNA uracil 4-sulfurtransferase ThiI [Patescibacteria group bacterium]|nr:tRNA uracil 4-sulfurtransferase ThiI [Patescibacteria group bacterium]
MILIHYHEIALKGKNRVFFEIQLVKNIKQGLDGLYKTVKRLPGRIVVEIKPRVSKDKSRKRLSKIFGVAYFVFADECESTLGEIKKTVLAHLPSNGWQTFKIETKRSYKQFPKTSQETSAIVGAHVLKNFKRRGVSGVRPQVNVKKPDLTCNIEITKDKTYIYSEKIKGAGGLPVGVSGKVAVLLSGGIDSPVAAHRIMKRGSRTVFIHFHSYPQTSKASEEKVKELAKILNDYQFKTRLYLVPFLDIQKEIMTKTLSSYRVILYRRFMFRIAEKIARRERALALATGESVGQVASQTIENINTVNSVAEMPVLRPLISYDKEEIIKEAQNIGTFEISIQPHDDCCTLFIPRNPATRGKLEVAEKEEKELGVDKLVKKCLNEMKVIDL